MSAVEDQVPRFTLGDRIRRARTHKRLEQADVAKALSVSRSLVSMWERDLSEPRVSQVREIAELTGVPESWLWSTSMYNFTPELALIQGAVPDDEPTQQRLPFRPTFFQK